MAPTSWLRKAITVFKKSSRSNPEKIDESDGLKRPGVFEGTKSSTTASVPLPGDAESAVISVPTLPIAVGSQNCLEVPALHDGTRDVDALSQSPSLECTMASVLQSPASSENVMNFFPNAQGFTIHKQNITVGSSKNLFDYLHSHIAAGASHNSAERCDAPKCHPQTRVAVQGNILSWIGATDEEEEPKKLLWLTGPAGAGKTAIAGSIADECEERGLLAGSFFFSSLSGSVDRRSKRCLVVTIAYQLSRHACLQAYSDALLRAVERDPTVLQQRMEDQMLKLVLAPLRAVHDQLDIPNLPKVIVLDGLDEVEAEQYHDLARRSEEGAKEHDHLEIISTLFRCAQDPLFPFRILISSRPERVFQDFFDNDAEPLTLRMFLDSKFSPDADILTFLEASFSKIRRKYRMSSAWPTKDEIGWIVEKASGQFIFASTVILFVGDSSHPPQAQLRYLLQLKGVEDGQRNPFGPLDCLYSQIFCSSPNPQLAAKWILGIKRYEPYDIYKDGRSWYAALWKPFLESFEGEADYILGNLTSLVSIPSVSEEGHSNGSFKIHHRSLLDFLDDRTRCGDLYADSTSVRQLYSDAFVRILRDKGPCIHPEYKSYWIGGFFICFFVRDRDRSRRSEIYSFLRCAAIEELASCDAAWWARGILSGKLNGEDPVGFVRFSERACAVNAFYHAVHGQCEPESCNVACRHWRSHILSAVGEFPWYSHSPSDSIEYIADPGPNWDRLSDTGTEL